MARVACLGQVSASHAVERAVLAAGVPVDYILPADGALLWGEHLVIPVDAPNKDAAERFIDFVNQPEVAAQVALDTHDSTTNDAALAYLPPEFLADRLIFPSNENPHGAEIALPQSAAIEARSEQTGSRFMDGLAYREVR